MENQSAMRFIAVCLIAIGLACALPLAAGAAQPRTAGLLAVGYTSEADLARAVAGGRADVVRKLGPLHVAEVRPHVADFAATALRLSGISYVEHVVTRRPASEPALFPTTNTGAPFVTFGLHGFTETTSQRGRAAGALTGVAAVCACAN